VCQACQVWAWEYGVRDPRIELRRLRGRLPRRRSSASCGTIDRPRRRSLSYACIRGHAHLLELGQLSRAWKA
jgi:hypothetical protein